MTLHAIRSILSAEIMKHRIFLTGAAGFVGFHLARALKARGDTVIGYDNFNDYYSPKLKRARATELQKVGVQVLEGDICDQNTLKNAIQTAQPDTIVHLAAQAGVRYSLANPHAYVKANLEGFVNILEACREAKTNLVYASSSSVYGRNSTIPFSITDTTDRQSNLYGVTKKSNELMAETYHHLYGIPVTGLRFFTVYGPWGRPDMAYYSFARAILADEPINIYAEGKLKRDFTYIDDIVKGTVSAIDLRAPNALFNLGNNHPVEVNELVFHLENALGKKAKKQFLPMQAGDMEMTYADISESTRQLGFVPQISLKEGIAHFAKWYLAHQFSFANIS